MPSKAHRSHHNQVTALKSRRTAYEVDRSPLRSVPAMAAKVKVSADGVELHTDRLRLRGALPEDAETLHKAFSDAEVMRYW